MNKRAHIMMQWVCFSFFCVLTACQHAQQNKNGRPAEAASFSEQQSFTQKLAFSIQPKKQILILDFWNDTPARQVGMEAFAAEELRKGLQTTRKVVVVNPNVQFSAQAGTPVKTDLSNGTANAAANSVANSIDGKDIEVQSALKTEDFVTGDHIQVAQLVRAGRRLGVSVAIIGRIKKMIFRHDKMDRIAVDLEMKVFDIQGGREILASTSSGEAIHEARSEPEALSGRWELAQMAIREAAAKFVDDTIRSVEKLTWQGRIARLIGSKIYINAGKASGLIPGDILKVLQPGEEIYDPLTGTLLGRSDGLLKGTVEVVDFLGMDATVAEVHTGSNFKEGDLVQLY